MSKFFFVTSYDKITSEIIHALMSVHPDIDCKFYTYQTLLPNAYEGTIDQFIKEQGNSQKKFHGNIQRYCAFELHHKTLVERTVQPFRKANIVVSPILRIRFLMHAWLKSGLDINAIIDGLEKEVAGIIPNELLNLYHCANFYRDILFSTMLLTKQVHENTKANPGISTSTLEDLTNPASRLFFLALAMIITFETADLPCDSHTFQLEAILTSEVALRDFLNHITNNEITYPENFNEMVNAKLDIINQSLISIANEPLTEWQDALVNVYLNKQLQTIYYPHIDHPLSYFYKKAKYQTDDIEISYSKLISIQLNSNRPAQLSTYFDNIEDTADNPEAIEVIVNIDIGDEAMKSLLDSEMQRRKFTIKYATSHRPASFCDLWEPLNKLYKLTDPNAYFLLNISDEMLFADKGWDTNLKSYVGFFPDHIFRLRASRNKFKTYIDRWECSFAQDSIPITTKRWIDIGGDWNPCFGPDSFQQLVAFYLAKDAAFTSENLQRDIPIIDVKFIGDVPALGLNQEKAWKIHSDSIKAMQICQSYPMQLEAKRRAMLLKANIAMKIAPNLEIIDNKRKKQIIMRTQGKTIATLSYRLSWLNITLINQYRKLYFYSYFGEGLIRNPGIFVSYRRYLMGKSAFWNKTFYSQMVFTHKIRLKLRKLKSLIIRSNRAKPETIGTQVMESN